jgi:tRNA threonylcarbamoyladenosine modification (KEOPS) complex  Pcc1 subunit
MDSAQAAPATPPIHRAELAFHLDDLEAAKAAAGALQVEAMAGPEGTRATVVLDGATLQVTLEAATVSDLRAALNSMVRLLDAALRSASVRSSRPGERNR